MPRKNRGEEPRDVVSNTMDHRVTDLPHEATTLEEHKRLGGVPLSGAHVRQSDIVEDLMLEQLPLNEPTYDPRQHRLREPEGRPMTVDEMVDEVFGL